ncbi:MAG: leucine-rich repeat domain-containing protein [Promethearchaeota archaeon]
MTDREELQKVMEFLGLTLEQQKKALEHSDTIFSGKKLISLSLSDMGLLELPQELFNNLKNLEILDIAGNKLNFAPEDIFDRLPQLKELYF